MKQAQHGKEINSWPESVNSRDCPGPSALKSTPAIQDGAEGDQIVHHVHQVHQVLAQFRQPNQA